MKIILKHGENYTEGIANEWVERRCLREDRNKLAIMRGVLDIKGCKVLEVLDAI